MTLLKLAQHAAGIVRCCDNVLAHPHDVDAGRVLAASLATLVEMRPDRPPVVLGVFNQVVRLGDNATYRSEQMSTSADIEALRSAIIRLHDVAAELRGVALQPTAESPSNGCSLGGRRTT